MSSAYPSEVATSRRNVLRRPARPERTGTAALVVAVADYAFAFLVILISTSAFSFLGLHSLFWIAAYAYFFLRWAMSFQPYAGFLARNAAYLAYPGLCMISVLWSDTQLASARFSTQLLVTALIAVFIGMRFTPRELLGLVQLALLIMMAASLTNLNGVFAYPFDHRGNFIGIFQSKNALGEAVVLFTIGCMVSGILRPDVGVPHRVLILLAYLATGFMVSISGSVTGMLLSVTMGVTAIGVYLTAKTRLGLPVLGMLALTGIVAGVIAVVVFQLEPIVGFLDLVGRDSSMTGRTVLWSLAVQAYLTRPLLGFGAVGFWSSPEQANIIAALQSLYGEGVTGFHSLALELLVSLGPLGLVVHFLAGYVTLRRAFAYSARSDGALATWAIAVTVALYAIAMRGTQLVAPHSLPLILLIATGAALGKTSPAPAPPGTSPKADR